MGFETGSNVTLTYLFPDINTVYSQWQPQSATVNNDPNDDWEFTNVSNGAIDVDIDFDKITIKFNVTSIWSSAAFNGWRLSFDPGQTQDLLSATSPSYGTTSFTSNSLSVNWQGEFLISGGRLVWNLNFASAGEELGVPTANVNEKTGIEINTSGTFSGDGTFSVLEADQTGNSILKNGKYGQLTVDSLTGYFAYTPEQDLIKPLKTGEIGVDEFTITLTDTTGTISSATYRVDIIGDTGSGDGGSGHTGKSNDLPDAVTGEWTKEGNAIAFTSCDQEIIGFYAVTGASKKRVKGELILDSNSNSLPDEDDISFGQLNVKKTVYAELGRNASGAFVADPVSGRFSLAFNNENLGKGILFNPQSVFGSCLL